MSRTTSEIRKITSYF